MAHRLDIRDGAIHYWLYQQDGSKQPMNCADTPDNRRFVEWTKIHDRYTPTALAAVRENGDG